MVFDFTSDYTATGPEQFLAGYAGYFQADALAHYEGLYGDDGVKHVCCVAHARRKFVAASDAGDERAAGALELIGKLYAVERALPPLLPPSDDPVLLEQRRQREEQRRAIRQRDAESVWDELSKWLGQRKPGALPKERTYADAKERGAIVTLLLPAGPLDSEAAREAAHSSNAKVLDAFRAHLFDAGLSPKVVERDLTHVAAFAEGYLRDRPEPRSLREFGPDDLSGYVTQVRAAAAVKDSQRRATLTGLKRFVRFLRDTERMDHHTAEDALEVLKNPR